jgi:hypothetical protein
MNFGEHSNMKGTRHKGLRHFFLASQPLGKWFGLVKLVRTVLAGAPLTTDTLLHNFDLTKNLHC